MADNNHLLALAQKLIENDLAVSAHILEGMTEEAAAEVLKSLPVSFNGPCVKASPS